MNDFSLQNSAGACNLHFTWLPGYVMGNAIGEEGGGRDIKTRSEGDEPIFPSTVQHEPSQDYLLLCTHP